MKNALNKLAAGLSVLPVLVLPSFANAATSTGGLAGAGSDITTIGQKAGFASGSGSDLPTLVGSLINAVLGVMGIVFVVLIVYAGILYMQAGQDPKKADKAKSLIVNSVIGLVIIVAAYAIASFIISQITNAVK